MINWKIHKSLAFIGMALVIGIIFGIKGISLGENLFGISFKWIAIIAQAYAAWVFYSLVKFN